MTIVDADGAVLEQQPGGYGEEGFVYQQRADTVPIDGKNVVIGSWVVGETPAGIDIRETSSLITGDLAEFVPHFIDDAIDDALGDEVDARDNSLGSRDDRAAE